MSCNKVKKCCSPKGKRIFKPVNTTASDSCNCKDGENVSKNGFSVHYSKEGATAYNANNTIIKEWSADAFNGLNNQFYNNDPYSVDSDGIFTAPVSGRYHYSAKAQIKLNDTGEDITVSGIPPRFCIFVNDTILYTTNIPFLQNSTGFLTFNGYITLNLEGDVYLNQNDKVHIGFDNFGGENTDTSELKIGEYSQNEARTQWSMHVLATQGDLQSGQNGI